MKLHNLTSRSATSRWAGGRLVGILIAALCFSAVAQADTEVPGDSVSGTWDVAGSPYIVQGNITVASSATLTVQVGVTVRFDAGCGLTVKGVLGVEGTSENMVTFTSNAETPAPGDWTGVVVESEDTDNMIEHAIVEYAVTGIQINAVASDAGATISNCIVRHCSGSGIVIYAQGRSASSSSVTGCDIGHNGDHGIELAAVGNAYDGIDDNFDFARVGEANAALTENRIHDNLGSGISCRGAGEYRYFSYHTDAWYLPPRPGHIDGTCSPTIRHSEIFSNSGHGILNHAKGYDFWHTSIFGDCHLTNRGYASPVVENSIIRNNAADGIYGAVDDSYAYCELEVRLNTIVGNSGSAVVSGSQATSNFIVENNIITGSTRGIEAAEGAVPTIRYNDVWGNSDGDYVDLPDEFGEDTNSNHLGDPCDVYGNISLDPQFLDADAGDYHLAGLSPCIDTGNPNSAYSDEPPWNGNRVNLGRYGNTADAASCPDRGPGIEVSGKDRRIANGGAEPSAEDGTDFGDLAIDADAVEHTFAISNPGIADLELTGDAQVTITQTGSAFSVTRQPTSPITPGGTTTFDIAFAPAAGETYTATVSIASNVLGEDSYTFDIRGTGEEISPVPLSPSGTLAEAVTRPTFTWTDVGWATWYEVFIRKEGAWDWGSNWVQGTTSWVPEYLGQPYDLPSGKYKWLVRGWSRDKGYGDWSEWMSFRVADEPPVPQHPSGTVTDARPVFGWSGVDWATWYEVFIRKEGAWDWGSNWVQGTTSWVPEYLGEPYDLPSGNYEWWVRGWSISKGYGEWSEGMSFRVAGERPVPQHPSETVTGTRPVFGWSGVEGATWYEVFIRKEGAWDWGSNWVQGTTSWVPEYLGQPYDLPSGNYEWWVRGWSIGDDYGVWSDGLPFTIVAPPQ